MSMQYHNLMFVSWSTSSSNYYPPVERRTDLPFKVIDFNTQTTAIISKKAMIIPIPTIILYYLGF